MAGLYISDQTIQFREKIKSTYPIILFWKSCITGSGKGVLNNLYIVTSNKIMIFTLDPYHLYVLFKTININSVFFFYSYKSTYYYIANYDTISPFIPAYPNINFFPEQTLSSNFSYNLTLTFMFLGSSYILQIIPKIGQFHFYKMTDKGLTGSRVIFGSSISEETHCYISVVDKLLFLFALEQQTTYILDLIDEENVMNL